jgi:hypothetical protein
MWALPQRYEKATATLLKHDGSGSVTVAVAFSSGSVTLAVALR